MAKSLAPSPQSPQKNMRKIHWTIPTLLFGAFFVFGIITTDGNDLAVLWMVIGIIGLVSTLLWFVFLRDMWRDRRVLKTGEPATARVLQMFETGITINDNPVVKLELEVTPQRGSTFVTMSKTLVSRLNPMMYGPGTVVSVKIDPQDPKVVVVDPEGEVRSGSAGANTNANNSASPKANARRDAAMGELIMASEKIRAELMVNGKDTEGTILSSWSLDVNVNDMATAMEFLVEVDLPGKALFKVEIKGVVANDNIGKYRIGTRVRLKYDPADPQNRITIMGVVNASPLL